MAENKIKCPKCGTQIPITEVLSHQLNEQVDEKVSKKLEAEKNILIEEFKKKYEAEQAESLKEIKEKLVFEEAKRQAAEKKELEFLKIQNELEDKLKKQELEIARQVALERKLIEEKIRKEEAEKQDFKNLELQKQLEDTKKALAEAQRKAQQGSMQTQGEVLELSLEESLKTRFPTDIIDPVPKGISGADITHTVLDKTHTSVGIIAWESKRTQNWTEDWVQKLKDDGRNIKANICVLVSNVLPKEIFRFGIYKGIWVCDFSSVIGLTIALRNQLIAVHKSIAAQSGKEEKKDILYRYLTSQTFAGRIESIVENFINMKSSLEKEQLAMKKIWSARESQITRLSENTVKMFGDIQGIAGLNLPTVEILELETAAADLEEETKLKTPKAPIDKSKDPKDQFQLFE
ncbi:MAG: DUF2130 domain-containing protein [Patescibacteria group bacterium]|jgi:hypothetical protein